MHSVLVAVLAASLLVTGAIAQPLQPGRPAGVQKARLDSTYEVEMIGLGAAIMVGVGILASGQSSVVNSQKFSSQPIVVPPINTTTSTASTS
jgi:hypothetical protein